GDQRVVVEVDRLAVVRLEEKQTHGRSIDALLSQVAGGEKIAVTLRHLRATHVEKLAMHPVAREGLARRPLRLCDLVFVMRKDQIDAAGVNVERLDAAALPNLVERHRRAFEMPARTAAPKWRIPCGADGFVFRVGFLPECEVRRVAFRVLVARDARTNLDLALVELRETAVGR